MGQEPPPSTGAPDGNGGTGQSRGPRLQNWQTLLAAVVSAAAAIIGIALTNRSDSPEPSPTPSVRTSTERRQEASILKALLGPHPKLPAPAVMVHLEGEFRNLEPGTAVVGRLGPERAADEADGEPVQGEQWVVANAVLDRAHGTWKLNLHLRRPAKRVLYQVGTASEDLWKGCTAEAECLTSPPDMDSAPSPSATADEDGPPEAEAPPTGFTPTTPLTDAETGQKYSSPPGQDEGPRL